MKTLFAKVEQVDADVQRLQASSKAQLESMSVRINTFDDGVVAALRSVLTDVNTVRAKLLAKTGTVDTRAKSMLPPP